jgi:hypothetical protein
MWGNGKHKHHQLRTKASAISPPKGEIAYDLVFCAWGTHQS